MDISHFKNSKTHIWFCDVLGYEIMVKLEVEKNETVESYSDLIRCINKWDVKLLDKLEPIIFDYYEDTLLMCGETESQIESPKDIWAYLKISSLKIFTHGSAFYVMADGFCDWEVEHGLEIDFNEFFDILYVGSFIGNGFYEDPKNPSYGNYVCG